MIAYLSPKAETVAEKIWGQVLQSHIAPVQDPIIHPMTSDGPLPLEHSTQPDTAFFVHVEDEHCGAAHGGEADEYNVGQLEMLFPRVLTRVEKRGDLARLGINACEISTFVRVASVAGQGQIRRLIIATVLARNDVLNVERRKRELLLPE